MIVRLLKKRLRAFLIATISGVLSLGLVFDFFLTDKSAEHPETLIQHVADRVITEAANFVPWLAKTTLGTVSVAESVNPHSYDRSEFGSWVDEDGDCQNTRHEMLILHSAVKPSLSSDQCYVKSGVWFDPYSGKQFQDPNQLDIDHVVPLKWAYESGAARWPVKKKKAFANDSANLLVVSAKLNRQKGADDPVDWLPPNRAFRCEYVIRFYKVARSYGLLNPDAAITLRELKTRECS